MSFSDLATMIIYFQHQCEKVDALVKEIDEINTGVTSEFVEAQDNVETAVNAAVAVADSHYAALAAALEGTLDAAMPAMRDVKGSRRVELEKLISELLEDRKEIEDKDAGEIEELGETNPALNEREEMLKAQRVELDAELQRVEEEIVGAGRGLGWLTAAGKIAKLRKQHRALATKLYGIRERLHEVRSNWVRRQTQADETQEKLQQAWRLRTSEIAKLNQELDSLTDDFEGTCRRAVIEAHIRGTEEFEPTGVEALDEEFRALTSWRQRQADCESGVIAVSEISGLLGGVREGMVRMRESIEGVKKEQDMHAELSTLNIEPPPAFLQFHELWDALVQTVVDEKRSIEHPAAFAKIVNDLTDSHLSNEQIEAMFNLAGDALTTATEQWD